LIFSRSWVPKRLRAVRSAPVPTPSGHCALAGESPDDSVAVAALDKSDVSYVRQRQAISAEQATSYCASCFVAGAPAGADSWSCTGGCMVTQPVCNICMEGVTQDGPYKWQESSSGFATRILLGQGFEGKGLGKDGQGTATARPPAAPRDSDHPRHGIGYSSVAEAGAVAFITVNANERLSPALRRLVRESHELSGHLSPSALAQAIRDGVIRNVPEKLTPDLILKVNRVEQCVVCEAARRTHEDVPQGSGAIPIAPGSHFSGDSLGPVRIATPEGYRYISLWEDCATGTLIAILTKSTGDDVYGSLRHLLELNDHLNHEVKSLRVDAGSSEGSREFAATRHLTNNSIWRMANVNANANENAVFSFS
jgi:hypothetical protein